MITARPTGMALDFRESHRRISFSLKIFILLVFTKALRVEGKYNYFNTLFFFIFKYTSTID